MKNIFFILLFAILGFTSCDKEYTVVIKQHTNMISSDFDKEDDTETIKAKDDAEAYRKAFISLVCHAHVKCDLYQYDNPLKFYMILEDKDGNRISHHVVEEKSELLSNLLFFEGFYDLFKNAAYKHPDMLLYWGLTKEDIYKYDELVADINKSK